MSAVIEYKRGTKDIEFVFLGGNAGHQAFKACAVVKRQLEAEFGGTLKVSFEPLWSTAMSDPAEGQESKIKDLSIWRMTVQKLASEMPKEALKQA